MKQEWTDISKELPPTNVLVKVMLTNGTEALDFVNEPIDKNVPFQHYLVAKWRMATREELNDFIQRTHKQYPLTSDIDVMEHDER